MGVGADRCRAVFAAVVVVRLVWALGRVIISTGSRRRRHRDLVDLLGREADDGVDAAPPGLRVLAEERPLAYCVPGLRESRVVVSAGTLAMLSPDELAAVLAHERAHLRARHDLVLATFDAVHQAFPHAIRSELPAEQCRLLVEMLADDAAVRSVGRGSARPGAGRPGGIGRAGRRAGSRAAEHPRTAGAAGRTRARSDGSARGGGLPAGRLPGARPVLAVAVAAGVPG